MTSFHFGLLMGWALLYMIALRSVLGTYWMLGL